jgi:hypothetical protein
MTRSLSKRSLRVALVLVATAAAAASLTLASSGAFAKSASHAASGCQTMAKIGTKVGRKAGIVKAVPASSSCKARNRADVVRNLTGTKMAGVAADGEPPLIWHGGAVMGTRET